MKLIYNIARIHISYKPRLLILYKRRVVQIINLRANLPFYHVKNSRLYYYLGSESYKPSLLLSNF
jgi:hypothetical protein